MKKEKIIFIISLVMMIFSASVSVYATSCLYNSSDVSYTAPTGSGLSANVQDSLTEVYGHCTDYTSMDTRVSSLEGHFLNNSTSVFNGSMLNIKSSDSNSSRGLDIRDASDTARSYLYYSPSYDRVYLTSNNSSGTAGAGSLDIQGDPITINDRLNIRKINVSSSNPYSFFLGTGNYNSLLIMGMVQGEGSVILGVKKNSSTLTVRNLMNGTEWSNPHLTFSLSGNNLNISSDISSYSTLVAIST